MSSGFTTFQVELEYIFTGRHLDLTLHARLFYNHGLKKFHVVISSCVKHPV